MPATVPWITRLQRVRPATLQLQRHDEQRRAEGYQHVRAQAGGLAALLALVAEYRAERRRQQQAQRGAGGLLEVGEIGELLAEDLPQRLPGAHRRCISL